MRGVPPTSQDRGCHLVWESYNVVLPFEYKVTLQYESLFFTHFSVLGVSYSLQLCKVSIFHFCKNIKILIKVSYNILCMPCWQNTFASWVHIVCRWGDTILLFQMKELLDFSTLSRVWGRIFWLNKSIPYETHIHLTYYHMLSLLLMVALHDFLGVLTVWG